MESNILNKDRINELHELSITSKLVFLIGYACDVGAFNCENRTGQEMGPNSFREILSKMKFPEVSAYYHGDDALNTRKVEVIDLGNISSTNMDLTACMQ